jgi:SNF2 family DNA or RNA helicase
MNFKFYPTLYYYPCNHTNFEERNNVLELYYNNNILNNNIENIKKLINPIFEFFNFHRLILDEGHEIFGELLTSTSLSKYMSKWISNIVSNYYWYVSGTPFINLIGLKNCAKFIKLKLEDQNRNFKIDFNKNDNDNNNKINYQKFLNKEYIWNNILSNICIKHRKIDVSDEINIPGYDEKIIWVNLTEIERKLYDTKKNKMTNTYLQQLCCHPLIVESSKKIFGTVEVDLSVMKDKLIDYHENNKNKYIFKLEKLDTNNQAYHMLKKSYENQISESNYLLNILNKIISNEIINDEGCVICMDEITNPTLTICGHLYCYDCIKTCLNNKKICPMCKKDLNGKDLMIINNKKKNYEDTNPLILKYGSKLGKLISIIRYLVIQNDTRIIIFSQWDDMLTLIGKTLSNNNIENSFVKGNVHSRNASISKFKLGGENKVIMLSLKNTASGTNLTEATHIFFVEPINTSIEECEIIEKQAIARACRIGQKNKVSLIRILIKNTIEEEIYNRNYAHKNIKEINIINNNEIDI